MPHAVILSPRARADLRLNAEWMSRNISVRSADRWLAAAEAAVQSLANHPHQHPEAEEAVEFGIDLRVCLHGRRRQVFRILFTIQGKTVNVLRVAHAVQDRLTVEDL